MGGKAGLGIGEADVVGVVVGSSAGVEVTLEVVVVVVGVGVGVGVNVGVGLGVGVGVGAIHDEVSNVQAMSQVKSPPAYPKLAHAFPFKLLPSQSSDPSTISSPQTLNLIVAFTV